MREEKAAVAAEMTATGGGRRREAPTAAAAATAAPRRPPLLLPSPPPLPPPPPLSPPPPLPLPRLPPPLASLAADALVLRRHERLCSAFRACPLALLTPGCASRDAAVRDAHSFAVVRCDEAAPARALAAVGDAARLRRLRAAVRAAVLEVAAGRGLEPALLDLGGGVFSGALAAEGVVAAAEAMAEGGEEEEEEEQGEAAGAAAAAAARPPLPRPRPLPRGRAALVERWAYLADSARDVLDANGFDASIVRVLHARADQVGADGRVRGGAEVGAAASPRRRRPPPPPPPPPLPPSPLSPLLLLRSRRSAPTSSSPPGSSTTVSSPGASSQR